MVIQTWMFGIHFLEHEQFLEPEQYETLQREKLAAFVVKDQI